MARLSRRWAPPLLGLILGSRAAVALPTEADPLDVDYSSLTWSDAFDALNTRLAYFYPFGRTKRIDWQELGARFAPRVVHAESIGSVNDYYVALREYAYSLQDGHIALSGESEAMSSSLYRSVAASFGLRLVELDDGRILVSQVVDGGPAAAAGITVGAEILGWNGLPIHDAIAAVSVIWADVPPARKQTRRLEQLALLTRAPLDERARITFGSPASTSASAATVELVARDDDALMEDLSPFPTDEELACPVDYSVLSGGVGYLRFTTFNFDKPEDERKFVETLGEAVTLFAQSRARGVILDLRRNDGGLNRLIVKVAGYFSRRRRHFETVTTFNPDNGKFEVDSDDPESHLDVLPQRPYYGGPVITLVGPGTMSAAEGLARAMQTTPHHKVLGIYGSHGTYGICSATVRLPEGLTFDYPYGRSLDVHGRTQLNADHRGQGGVRLDVRVPLDEKAFAAKFSEGRDIELERALREIEKLHQRRTERRTKKPPA